MNVPQVVAYRLNPISARLVYYIARFKISFASPVNLAVNKAVVPEFLQWQVTPQALADTGLGFTHQPYRPTNHAQRLPGRSPGPGRTRRMSSRRRRNFRLSTRNLCASMTTIKSVCPLGNGTH